MSAQQLPSQLAEVVRELGLSPADARLTRLAGPGALLVLPGPQRPQMLVPASPAGAVVIAERRARGRKARLIKGATAAVLRTGAAAYVPLPKLQLRGPGLRALAQEVSGGRCTEAAVLFGPPRANRKPVLRLFADDGSTWGYTKLGVNDLTDALVLSEATALDEVWRHAWSTVEPTRVVGRGSWHGRHYLTTAALALAGSTRQPDQLPVAPTREVFGQGADVRPLSAWELPEVAHPRLDDLRRRLLALAGETPVPTGAAHGDWTPWNMAWRGSPDGPDGVLEVWDWERFALNVPQGLDLVHFEASRVRVDDNLREAEPRLLAELPLRLHDVGLDASNDRLLLAAYLIWIGGRYAADLGDEPVPALQRRLDWVLDLLDRTVAELAMRMGGIAR